jgi:hypothetical protein
MNNTDTTKNTEVNIKVSAFVIVNNSCWELRLNVVNSCGHRIVFFASFKFSGQVLWQRFQAIAIKIDMEIIQCLTSNLFQVITKLAL